MRIWVHPDANGERVGRAFSIKWARTGEDPQVFTVGPDPVEIPEDVARHLLKAFSAYISVCEEAEADSGNSLPPPSPKSKLNKRRRSEPR